MPPPETNSPPPSPTAGGFSGIHPDIIDSHILTRLDGQTLASAACCSTTLRHRSSDHNLWSNLCRSTWPSTAAPRAAEAVSAFPDGGPRAFFPHAFSLLTESRLARSSSPPPAELLSAVDIRYRGDLIFTKLHETAADSDWFRSSPLRIDLLEPKDVVPTGITLGDDAGVEILNGMTLSWIIIDPIGRRAANLSSQSPVAVQRHWLTGEVQVRFASIVAVDGGHVQCGIVVTCGGEMLLQVREVSLEIEDTDGMHLSGEESLVILQGALEGKKGTGRNRVQEARRRHGEFAERKRERRERKLRREGALDMACVAFGVSVFVAFWCYLLCR